MEEKEVSLQDVIIWIVEHSDDEVAMEKINRTTYPFTRKFKDKKGTNYE